ncbi:hypothetical protein ACIRPU_03000 [Streptomyces sp. NPDC102259]|uniref:hypothetical protein n=1 Tax=Streptomyces sp. NPDC102259 TaxID=3366148 RepID=UPI003823F9EB
MTGRVPEIWVGDLVRALAAAGDDPAARRGIAHLLGFTEGAPAPVPIPVAPVPCPPAAVPSAPPHVPPPVPVPDVTGDRDEPPSPDPGPSLLSRPPDLPVLEVARFDAPDLTDWEAIPSLDVVTERHLSARPQLEPLLTGRSSAAILNAMLTTRVRDDGEPDIDSLVEAFARGIPLTRLPRAARPTLRFGVQVLVDLGDAMQPYHRDQQDLVGRITGLVGAELTQVRYFADAPTRGTGPGARRTWLPYRTPSPGTRVLVVSDLGAGGPVFHPRRALAAEWYGVLDEIVRAGCTALALVPYPADRVPTELTRLLSVLTWDRSTTASTVAAVVGRRS